MKYYFNKITNYSFDEAIEKVTEELQKEGFGVLTEIDVTATLKKKLDIIRTNEIERLKATLPQNGHVEQINTLTESIVNKVVRQHVKSLKKVAHDPEEYKKQIELILSIYELENEN